jgi:hypothetical protein
MWGKLGDFFAFKWFSDIRVYEKKEDDSDLLIGRLLIKGNKLYVSKCYTSNSGEIICSIVEEKNSEGIVVDRKFSIGDRKLVEKIKACIQKLKAN